MVPDAFDLLKPLWVVLGPLFGSAIAPPKFWAYLKAAFGGAWELLEPAWNGKICDWILLEERCRHVGLRLGSMLLTIAVLLLNARVIDQPCSQCGKHPVRRWRWRGLNTTCGKVTLFRQEQDCACGMLATPADRALGLPPDDRISPDLVLWSARVGASMPFEPARIFFRDLTGQDVISRQGVHDQVRAVAQALPEMNEVPAATTPGELPARVVVDMDGAIVGLHHRAKPKQETGEPEPKKKNETFEVMVARVYERHDALCGGKIHVYRHLAFTGGVSRAGDDVPLAVFNTVNQRFPGAIPERVVYVRGDGARNITTTANKFPHSKRLLDMYHGLCKYTERLKQAFRGMPGRKRRVIDDELSALHRAGDVEGLLAKIEALKSHPDLVTAEPLDKLAGWVKRNRKHLWYDEARELGLGVGTGITEKDVDLVLDRRLELRGMSWTPKGVSNVLRIRIAMFNDMPASLEAAVRRRQPRPSS